MVKGELKGEKININQKKNIGKNRKKNNCNNSTVEDGDTDNNNEIELELFDYILSYILIAHYQSE